jgi:hypothetical protein
MSSCNNSALGDAGGASEQFMNGPCTRTNAVGGCKVTSGSVSATTWFYQPTPLSTVQQACSGTGTFVSP